MFGILGVPELLVLAVFLVPVVLTIVLVVWLLRAQRRRALAAGYPSLSAYLRATPQTDQEKRDATDLALKGLAICLLGLLFPPLLLVGLFPFFYGARKVMYVSMGLGLVDDPRR
ncbi:MAG: hypothetical protein NUW22_03985 [Acidobacteria bacterium]|nr:hypothetical protein [Acidobacteriota bacterium]